MRIRGGFGLEAQLIDLDCSRYEFIVSCLQSAHHSMLAILLKSFVVSFV